jgi:hypothetical protein
LVNITDSMDTVAQYVVDKLKTNYAALTSMVDGEVGSSDDVYYGDQELMPRTPSICVDPGTEQRTLQGVSFRTDNNFVVYIYVYHAKIQDNQLTRKEVQQVSEAIATLLHQDPQLGGLVIHSYVALNESGYTYRGKTMYRTNRLTFEPYSKTRLR